MWMQNYTPFPNLRFFGMDNEGREFGVLLIKGTYTIGSDGWLEVAGDQEPLVMTDTYHGELNVSSLYMPSDIVSLKPRSDIILNAVARAPGGQALPSWICSVRVEGNHLLEKRLRVTGPRRWEPQWGVSQGVRVTMTSAERRRLFDGWRLSEPEPVTEVPIRYELAYGGLLLRPQEGTEEPFLDPEERNPIGRGWIDADHTPLDYPVPAPQIEDAREPITAPHQRPAPVGFGSIPPAWLPRRPLGGTYDDHWRAHVWPKWPADYDFAYNNSAHPDLIYPGMLRGDEVVRLVGLYAEAGERVLRAPHHAITVEVHGENGRSVLAVMNLDTLLLDIAAPDPAQHRAYLTWRAAFDHQYVVGLTFAHFDFRAEPGFPLPRRA